MNQQKLQAVAKLPSVRKWLSSLVPNQVSASDVWYEDRTETAAKDGSLQKAINAGLVPADEILSAVNSLPIGPDGQKNMKTLTGPTTSDIQDAAGRSEGLNVRVKRASERYRKDSETLVNKSTGQPLLVFGQPAKAPSELNNAMIGAWFKHYLASQATELQKAGLRVPVLNEHEQQLLQELVHEGHFCGEMKGGQWVDRATLDELKLDTKTILNDSTSGGSSLVPYQFDQDLITQIYLTGQLLPFVDARTATSSDVKTSRMGSVSIAWGTSEGTAVSLFDTDSLLTQVDLPVYPATACVEYGKDFEADTPVSDFGTLLLGQFAEAARKELDYVIALGNGTTQPEGFLNATGTVTVNSDNNTTGPITLNDCTKTLFGIGLQYRQDPGMNICFVSNDTTYLRTRQIRVDPHALASTVNQLPVFGMDSFNSYETAGFPHKINNSIGNSTLAAVALKRYRLYRRTGLEFFVTDQGSTLARRNTKLIVMRMRVAGKLVDPNGCCKMADAQS